MHMISQLVSSGSILVNIEKWGSLELSEKESRYFLKKKSFYVKNLEMIGRYQINTLRIKVSKKMFQQLFPILNRM